MLLLRQNLKTMRHSNIFLLSYGWAKIYLCLVVWKFGFQNQKHIIRLIIDFRIDAMFWSGLTAIVTTWHVDRQVWQLLLLQMVFTQWNIGNWFPQSNKINSPNLWIQRLTVKIIRNEKNKPKLGKVLLKSEITPFNFIAIATQFFLCRTAK